MLQQGPQDVAFLETAVVWWCGIQQGSQEMGELNLILAQFAGAR